ncbi:DUF4148 domain-containing protein [Nonomuraea sp. NPDC050691]|uniref:DUF4148 domain-containing protein n=1 Tax=Nonomuraea sp. NPDC050691 TaxID=3155661 RepID=UPI0033C3CB74
MRTRRVMMLASPALLGALAFGPAVESPASASTGTTETSAQVVQTATGSLSVAPGKRWKRRYNRGHDAGFSDGRSDCKNNKPYDLNFTGSGPFHKGYRDGYNSGFHSCTPKKEEPKKEEPKKEEPKKP